MKDLPKVTQTSSEGKNSGLTVATARPSPFPLGSHTNVLAFLTEQVRDLPGPGSEPGGVTQPASVWPPRRRQASFPTGAQRLDHLSMVKQLRSKTESVPPLRFPARRAFKVQQQKRRTSELQTQVPAAASPTSASLQPHAGTPAAFPVTPTKRGRAGPQTQVPSHWPAGPRANTSTGRPVSLLLMASIAFSSQSVWANCPPESALQIRQLLRLPLTLRQRPAL